ncbi:MAG TPA: site-specific DNA-methyltransferase [Candidatus Paceibacterota bacterium]|nr:site-specific DNA-methyltransferase [Candidatus Paceibacterota bacterium]
MAKKNTKIKEKKIKDISLSQYLHKQKRANNPQVGLVSSELDTKPKKKVYQHDPYIDPTLSWAGKAEGMSFDVDTVSLHIHERIDPKRIIKQVLKKTEENQNPQVSLFEQPSEILNIEKEFDFYGHTKNWSNRLIAGDSLLVMNSLLEKENMSGKVQMIYIDPPYGIKFNSNFQPFTNKKDVKDKDDASIPAEPEMIKAFRDTWELGIHSYLTHLRDRLLLARELLHESGSIFVQISDENVHHVREIIDEIFGVNNFISQISFKKTSGFASETLDNVSDYLIWYGKDKKITKYRQLYEHKMAYDGYQAYNKIELKDGSVRNLTKDESSDWSIVKEGRIFRLSTLESQGASSKPQELEFEGKIYNPSIGSHWKTDIEGLQKLIKSGRIVSSGKSISYKRYIDDFPVAPIVNIWEDTVSGSGMNKIYVVQTNQLVIQRCLLMTTDPGDLVLDITCGAGTTAFVAEQWGRRWITCDTSRVAIQLAKQRLMTAKLDYYEMAQNEEGVSSGFKYKTVPHITLGSIAKNEPAKEEALYDQPIILKDKVRVTGPFTVEAVPGIRTKPIDGNLPDVSDKTNPTNIISEKFNDYLDNIRASGIRSYNNDGITFNSVEVAEGFNEIHAFGNIEKDAKYTKCAIVFGPDYAQMEQTQIERTMDEIRTMTEKPGMVVFCSYAFDPEASKDIDNIKIPGLQIIKAQMNTDLLTKDLKKKANTNKPFWLIGEPDIEIHQLKDGKYQVEVKGFDCYDPTTQELRSCGPDKISMWMLDTEYDNKSIFPSQIFFPMGDNKRDWTKLAKALNGIVDEELLEQYTGTTSIPFTPGEKKIIAVKIVDDRGVEMLIVKKL